MKKSNIYTRKGDTGTTQLASGERVAKTCLRLEAYGTIDELNAQLGLLLADIETTQERQRLVQSQRDLFTIGAWLATTTEGAHQPRQSIGEADIEALERAIDKVSEELPPWRGFVLPGGNRAAAMAHVCRTVCRRAERVICRLADETEVDPRLMAYVNRLSDYLFVLARKINFSTANEEILW